ncbi:hypothetical protein K0M31_020074 [Melipona bicolor]|uniref:Uncharacterized protein n=1 Tax=Melipona bicolor TaxID=60889 RepID=A0AA40KQD8_9HYME|nr:hypothetical protein K0M31_020074 [Melipona bicolor]
MNCQLECIKIRTTANRTSSTKIRTDGSLNLFGDGEHVGEPRFLGGRVSMTKNSVTRPTRMTEFAPVRIPPLFQEERLFLNIISTKSQNFYRGTCKQDKRSKPKFYKTDQTTNSGRLC